MKVNLRKFLFITAFIPSYLGITVIDAAFNLAHAEPLSLEGRNINSAPNNWQDFVESLARNPKIVTMRWPQMRKLLPAGCVSKPNDTELVCPSIDGVVSISAIPGPTGVVDVTLKSPVTCEVIYNLMNKHLGIGKLNNGNKCDAEWSLNRWANRSYATVRSARKDPSIIFLQLGTEQGP